MKIEVLYKNHSYEEFDSYIFTNAEPYQFQGCNILTDWILHLDKLEEYGIILVQHWYNMKQSNGNIVIDGVEVPGIQRNLGKSMLLVAANEVQNIIWVKKDGELILWREGADLIHGDCFFTMQQRCLSLNKNALALFDYLTNTYPDESDENIAKSMGYTISAIERIRDAEFAQCQWDDENNMGDTTDDPDSSDNDIALN
ncbi:hypothetical protein AB1I62_03990 [Enterococcus sp. AN402]|uniref:hypothetical protein n=1 Tax=Enterococcus sp. AN402 TaxID=3151386 RepID=UPI00345A607B